MKAVFVTLFATALYAQTPLAFEKATITIAPYSRACGMQYSLLGQFDVYGCALKHVIGQVYGVRDFQVVEAPEWASEDIVHIYALGDGTADTDQRNLMARNLLTDRFQLKAHREMREMPVYALMTTPRGPLQIAKPNSKPVNRGYISPPGLGFNGVNVSMETFAERLSGITDRPVIDKTNFTGAIDFTLHYGKNAWQSIFPAIAAQLGLVLQPERDSVEVLVVDHVEQPSAN